MRMFDRIADANDAPSTVVDSDSDDTVINEEEEEEEYPYNTVDLSKKIRRDRNCNSMSCPEMEGRSSPEENMLTEF